MNKIIEYFDLGSSLRPQGGTGRGMGGGPKIHWIPQYIAFSVGILLEPFIPLMANGVTPPFGALVSRLGASFIVGMLVFPGVYKNSFDPAKPLAIQLMAIVPIGVGWRDLFNAI